MSALDCSSRHTKVAMPYKMRHARGRFSARFQPKRNSMKKQFFRAVITACLLGSAAVIAPVASLSPALAASGPSVSGPVGKILLDAQKAYQANDFAGGLTLAKQAQALPDRTEFDNYEINKMVAFGAIKTNDMAGAYDAELAMAS